MLSRFHVLLIIGVLLVEASVGAASAQSLQDISINKLPKATELYSYKSWNQDVQEALKIFSKNLNVPIEIDEVIKGRITGADNKPRSYASYLDALGSKFGFTWYYDGIVLYVEDVSKIKTEFIPLKSNNTFTTISFLKSIGIYQEKFIHEYSGKNSAIRVSGPASYVDRITSSVGAIEDSERGSVVIVRGQRGSDVDDALGLLTASGLEGIDNSQSTQSNLTGR